MHEIGLFDVLDLDHVAMNYWCLADVSWGIPNIWVWDAMKCDVGKMGAVIVVGKQNSSTNEAHHQKSKFVNLEKVIIRS